MTMASSDIAIVALSLASSWGVGFLVGLLFKASKQLLEKIL